jgi:phage tail sheath gpL-like
MTVTFLAGPFYNPQTATLTINDNAPGGPQTVPLTATVINPQAKLNTGSLNFGNVKAGSSAAGSVTLTNTGATPLAIVNIAITGATADFGVSSSTCPTSLAAGSSCSIGVTFRPAKGSWTGALVITDNAKDSPQSVTLSGKGN